MLIEFFKSKSGVSKLLIDGLYDVINLQSLNVVSALIKAVSKGGRSFKESLPLSNLRYFAHKLFLSAEFSVRLALNVKNVLVLLSYLTFIIGAVATIF